MNPERGAADFYAHAIAKLEANDWSACWASPPVSHSDISTGETLETWAHWRPLSAVECKAWGLPVSGRLGIMVAGELAGGAQWTLERYLVRLPVGARPPQQNSGAVLWAATQLGPDDYVKLTPGAVARLRLVPSPNAEASA